MTCIRPHGRLMLFHSYLGLNEGSLPFRVEGCPGRGEQQAPHTRFIRSEATLYLLYVVEFWGKILFGKEFSCKHFLKSAALGHNWPPVLSLFTTNF